MFYIFTTRCRRTLIFQIKNDVKYNSLSLKYQKFTTSGWKDMGIKFVTKTQFKQDFANNSFFTEAGTRGLQF